MLSVRPDARRAATLLLILALSICVGCGRKAGSQASLPLAPAPAPAAQPAPAAAPNAATTAGAGDASFLPSLQQVAQSRVHYKFVLDETTREYHWWNCTVATSKGNAVTPTTMSREQIAAAGYRPCAQCRPNMDALPVAPAPPPSREPQRLGPPPAKEMQAPIEVGTPETPKDGAKAAAPRPAAGQFPKATATPTRPPTSATRTTPPTKAPTTPPPPATGHPTTGQVPAAAKSK